ncbi:MULTISPECIES: exodeoxyribonuclease III [Brachybacterium]|uniref:Exodeoxyribonuclease III n=1 Tax=Brachybacterium alimentarium TaxID=47845 RepID=A0A2A3YIM9_9MICO|nr:MULTISPECIES: exodeoxyribonuclease III [Brachybacterium]PCC35627.1 exodeoxyribonuclease III [Brachybacterium alimentarium]PCC39153.1 exodeoxyribonuclease III [Brachybacterium alimentarium]RCS64695.1 exodeoxyribonuclease III [Brachybacterium sp. JB7]RCS66590.1 exodeoxyribonuclease III [Brachybacterium alimentarium]
MSLTIATVNVNGLRAAERKGMRDWLASTAADVVTLQEVRAPEDLLPGLVGEDWAIVGEVSELKGRAGAAIAARTSLGAIDLAGARHGLPGLTEPSHTGRWLEADLADPFGDGRALTVISCYMHSGNTEKPQTMTDKYEFLDVMIERLEQLRADGRHVVLTGDINIAHTEWDIKNWKGNLKSAGFLPEERAYLDRLTTDAGFVDVHRTLHGDGPGPYTWWSQRGKAFDNDAGWRIDYQLATEDLAARATSAQVDRAPSYDTRWSDHAPLVISYS